LFVGCAEAHKPFYARCNHDELQRQVNRLAKREELSVEVNYFNETVNGTVVAPFRFRTETRTKTGDKFSGYQMACTAPNVEVYMKGKMYKCTKEDVLSDAKQQVASKAVSFIRKFLAENFNVTQVVNFTIEAGDYGGAITTNEVIVRKDNILSDKQYDLLIYQTYRPDSWDVVVSGTCLIYDQNGRPVAAHLNWNPRNLDPNGNQRFYRIAILHEMFHILGFSQSRMLDFRNYSTYDPETGDLEEYSIPPVAGLENDGRDLTLLTTPGVKKAFREHTGCNTLEGGILEDQGGDGVAGSHWEMMAMMDELMTGTISERSFLSEITLAALADSGWYTISPNALEASGIRSPIFWGYKKGCDFALNRCNNSWPVGEGYYCPYEKKGTEGCTYDRMGVGLCDFRYWTTIPEKYRYFSDEHIGGPVELANYCPFTFPSSYCDVTSKSAEASSYGDVTGSDSRCFMSTLTDSPDATTKQPEAPKCYPRHCLSKESYAVKLGNYWYPCPTGESISDILSFSGSLKCADASILCRNVTEEDTKFPIFESIDPVSAKPGTTITIKGKNLAADAVITLGVPCEDTSFDESTGSISCVIPEKSQLSADIGVKNIIIKQNGFSIAIPNGFTLELSATSWILNNWFIVACASIGGLVLLLTIVIIICKCCTTQRKWKKYQEAKQGAGKKQKSSAEFGGDVEFDSLA